MTSGFRRDEARFGEQGGDVDAWARGVALEAAFDAGARAALAARYAGSRDREQHEGCAHEGGVRPMKTDI